MLHNHYDNYKAEQSGYLVFCVVGLTLSWGCIRLLLIPSVAFPVYLGVPQDMLKAEFYVPDSSIRKDAEKFRGKQQFGEVFTVTHKTTLSFFTRVIQVGKLQMIWSKNDWYVFSQSILFFNL